MALGGCICTELAAVLGSVALLSVGIVDAFGVDMLVVREGCYRECCEYIVTSEPICLLRRVSDRNAVAGCALLLLSQLSG